MATIGTLAVAITATTSGITRGIQQTAKMVGSLGATTASAGKMMSAGFGTVGKGLMSMTGYAARATSGVLSHFGSMAKRVGNMKVGNPFQMGGALKPISMGLKAGALAGTAGALGAATWGVSMAIQAEQAQISFEVMLGSAAKARAMLAQLEQFAAKTPFQLAETREAAQLLLNFGIAGDRVLPNLSMIGDIAAGDSEKLHRMAVAFGQSSSAGRLMGQDLLQMINAGFNPLQEISAKTGESMGQLKKRMEDGKIPFSEVIGAFQMATSEGGRFYQMSQRQSQTTAGLWSTFKDNVALSLGAVSKALMDGLDVKSLLRSAISFTEGVRTNIASIIPIAMQFGGTIISVFTSVWEMISSVSSVFGSWFGITSMGMETVRNALLIVEYSFQSWQTVLQLAATQVMLSIATFAGDVTHFFTGVIPAVVSWGAENFFNIWMDSINATLAGFKNFGSNILTNMKAIWAFIKSGGTADLNLSWTPLLEGFESTIKEMPNIPKREMGAIEKALTESRDAMANKLGEGFAEFKARKDAEVAKLNQVPALANALDNTQLAGGPDLNANKNVQGESKAPKSYIVDAAMKDSKEAFKIIMDAALGKDKKSEAKQQLSVSKQQLDEQKKQTEALKNVNSSINAAFDFDVVSIA